MAKQPDRVNTVLFDLDDTLLDSIAARVRALDNVFSPYKIPGLNASRFIQELKGRQLKDVLAALAAAHNINEDLFTAYRRAYWLKKPGEIRLYPGIFKVLKTLKAADIKLGLVTQKECKFEIDGQKVGAFYETVEVGISNLFAAAVGFADVTKHKPDPESILLALNKLGSNVEETLMVGDSAADVGAAQNAGCRSCYATWGLLAGLPEDLKAHYTVKAPRDLLKLDCLKEKPGGKER